jgi:hypothetical protein
MHSFKLFNLRVINLNIWSSNFGYAFVKFFFLSAALQALNQYLTSVPLIGFAVAGEAYTYPLSK